MVLSLSSSLLGKALVVASVAGAVGVAAQEDTTSSVVERRFGRDDRRIAAAVKLALDGPGATPEPTEEYCKLYRFRTSTVNREDQCVLFDSSPSGVSASPGTQLEGAEVRVFIDGNPDASIATFDASNVASPGPAWSLTFSDTPDANGATWILRSTLISIEKVEIDVSKGAATFDILPYGEGHLDNTPGTEEGRSSFDEDDVNVLDPARPFRGRFSGRLGLNGEGSRDDLFRVLELRAPKGEDFITEGINDSVGFDVDVDQLESVPVPPLDERLCDDRDELYYGEGLIVTTSRKTSPKSVLEHPLVFDAVERNKKEDKKTFADAVDALHAANLRMQIVLHDAIEDNNVFSRYSTNTHFTPCFRVKPVNDFSVEVLFGIQDEKTMVHLHVVENIFADELGCLPVPKIDTFNGDLRTLYPVAEIKLDDDTRTFESFDSDVQLVVEECPEWSYFL